MNETRKEKAERLINEVETANAAYTHGQGFDKVLEDARSELLSLCLETPDIPTPPSGRHDTRPQLEYLLERFSKAEADEHDKIRELILAKFDRVSQPDIPTPGPVAVEDIVPGWYWVTDDDNSVVRYAQSFKNEAGEIVAMSVSETGLYSGIASGSFIYTAPSPAALMQMCREVVTAEEVPPVINDIEIEHALMKTPEVQRFLGMASRRARATPPFPETKPDDIPLQVEVAMVLIESDSTPESTRLNATRLLDRYLESGYSSNMMAKYADTDKQGTPEPAAIETCGECEHWQRDHQPDGALNGIYNGSCDKIEDHPSYRDIRAVVCPHATPKAEVAP